LKPKEQEFLQLINQHKRIIYKISRTYVDDPEERKDLSQEIIVQLWKSYDSFQSQSQFSTWMYRVALNTAITNIRQNKKRSDCIRSHPEIDIADCDQSAEKEDQLAHFYRAVQELSPIEKALIFLFLEGRSHKEIGHDLGISEVNARVRLNRTKEKLQLIIKKNGYEF
jgi:RNA polymerase sigma-70 factor (ECF subfamily)